MAEFCEDTVEDAKQRQDLLERTIGNCMNLMYILAIDGPKQKPAPVYTARIRDSAHSM